MMTELMIRGRTDDVLCVPVDRQGAAELGMGHQPQNEADRRYAEPLKDCMLQFIHDRS